MSKVTKNTLFPKTLTMPGSGIVVVQDAFDPYKYYSIFPTGEKSWTEKISNVAVLGK